MKKNMFTRFLVVVGGVLAALSLIVAIDSFFARDRLVSGDFAKAAVQEVLDDPDARAPLVDELTDQWIADHPERFALLQATTSDARAVLWTGIDEIVVTAAFETETNRAIDEISTRQDELATETVELDLGPAVDSASSIPPQFREVLRADSTIELTRDLSRLSDVRTLLQLMARTGAAAAGLAILVVLGATQSLRRTIRPIALVGLPLAVVQPWVFDGVLVRVEDLIGDSYGPVVTTAAAEQMTRPFTVVMVLFGVLASVELIAIVGSAMQRSAEKDAAFAAPVVPMRPVAADPDAEVAPTLSPVSTNPASAPGGIEWIDPNDEQRLAS